MSDDIKFTEGMIVKKPHENAPSFVKEKISFKVDEFIAWLRENEDNGWVNVQIKESQSGKLYGNIDTWKPQQRDEQQTTQKPHEVDPDDDFDNGVVEDDQDELQY